MATVRYPVVVAPDEKTLAEVDRWVREGRYPNRSRAVQAALADMAQRQARKRLSQVRTISIERLGERVGAAKPEELAKTVEGLIELLA